LVVRATVPTKRKSIERARPKLDPAVPFIDGILESDLKAPRKQRHTARRIYSRLLVEKTGHLKRANYSARSRLRRAGPRTSLT
jgi:hypothetical protein